MLVDFLVPFLTIALAEFLDKSQLAIMLLTTKTKNYSRLLLGVMLAFFLVDGTAVIIGSTITTVVSPLLVRIVSAAAFISFGFITFFGKDKLMVDQKKTTGAFISGFTLVFLTEWGDKTQIASGIFAARYNPFIAFTGILFSLFLLSLFSLYFGRLLMRLIRKDMLEKVTGIVFIIIGIVVLTL